uniref:EGF-like domain-containing protein n=1 Tax=Parastrongyloides trichosuri TaxID=131310 RepID=A0A0N4Z7S7_PARTI
MSNEEVANNFLSNETFTDNNEELSTLSNESEDNNNSSTIINTTEILLLNTFKERKKNDRNATGISFLQKSCLNNGTYVNGKCQCIYPYTGVLCQDFACVNGLSTGPRYNKQSLFFSKMCICNDGWDGELCDVPTTEQCNERGNYVHGICECQGLYFGENCQYVRGCIHGNLSHGRCLCESGWEGDLCDSIICRHGHPNLENNSESCVCPYRYAGIHCEKCAQQGKHVTAYPECTVEIVPHASEIFRKKNDHQMLHRIYVIGISLAFLAIVTIIMFARRWIHLKLNPPQEDIIALRSQYYHTQLERLLENKEKAEREETKFGIDDKDIPLIT